MISLIEAFSGLLAPRAWSKRAAPGTPTATQRGRALRASSFLASFAEAQAQEQPASGRDTAARTRSAVRKVGRLVRRQTARAAPAAGSSGPAVPTSANPASGEPGEQEGSWKPAQSKAHLWPLAGAVAALALGWGAESLVRTQNTTSLSLLLYLAAIFLFALTAPGKPVQWGKDLAAEPQQVRAAIPGATQEERALPAVRHPLLAMLLTVAGSIALGVTSIILLLGDLSSVPAVWLWLLSMVVLLTGSIIVGRWQNRQAFWGRNVWPKNRKLALAAIGTIVLIMVVASAARLIGLDRVPFGINADEGDRAATAIQIIRGQNTQSLFDNGWYWISNLYFWVLAQVMKIAGISYVGARVFGAVASVISVGVIIWLGTRNFGLRVGLVAGSLLSLLAVSLQFARETSEAGPTATLWAVSVACFLEAARRGRYWAWAGAGLAGGLSIYFYPTGRLWVGLAALVCGYLLVHGPRGRRLEILAGSALASLASILAAGPFLLRSLALGRIEMLTQRAQETSIFTGDNVSRLDYVEPGWNTLQLLTAQVVHSVGILNQFPGQTDFWPFEQPILPIALSLLAILGLGWCCIRVRDPRFAILAIWFWVGLVGVIVTVETPNLQRMATAIPVLALFPALALDSIARRVEGLADGLPILKNSPQRRALLNRAGASGLAAVVVALAAGQYGTYFEQYGQTDRWPQPSYLGWAVRDQGTNTLTVTLGQQSHMVNAGWVRLLAPDAPRGGIIAPGSDLPLALPSDRNLTFVVFPGQAAYLPYLRALYPGAIEEAHTHPTEGLMFTTYRLAQAERAQQQGALARPPEGEPRRVSNLGVRPPDWSVFPGTMRWTATLSVPQYWNYAFRVMPGPARLEIDGREVVSIGAGEEQGQAIVSLARGSHYLSFDGTLRSAGQAALVRWARVPEGEAQKVNYDALQWQEIPTQQLAPAEDGPHGLFAVVKSDGYPEQRRIDGAVASCQPAGQELAGAESTEVSWGGTLDAPSSGVYSMTLFVQGPATLNIDGKPLIAAVKPLSAPVGAEVELSAGLHPVRIDYSFGPGPGCIEWTWTPPGGEKSIVPPSVLAPAARAGVGDPMPGEVLGSEGKQPGYSPLNVVP